MDVIPPEIQIVPRYHLREYIEQIKIDEQVVKFSGTKILTYSNPMKIMELLHFFDDQISQANLWKILKE